MRMLLIDKVISVGDAHINTLKNVTLNEDIYEHHFKNYPIMPAAFIIEASIQSARLWLWKISDMSETFMPLDFQKFTFTKSVLPGDTLSINIKLMINSINNERKLKANIFAFSNNKTVCKGKFSGMIVDFLQIHEYKPSKQFYDFVMREVM